MAPDDRNLSPADPLPEQRVGAAMRHERKHRRVGLREMARQIHYSHSRLSDYERGNAMPSEKAVERYEQVLVLKPGTLMKVLEKARIERYGDADDAWARQRVNPPIEFMTASEGETSARSRRLFWWRSRHAVVVGACLALIVILGAISGVITAEHRGARRSSCVAIGKGDPVYVDAFQAAFTADGGSPALGCGLNSIHPWGPGFIQDLRGGKAGSAAIMALDPTYAYVLAGPAWTAYEEIGGSGGSAPLAGYPASEPTRVGRGLVIQLRGAKSGDGGLLRGDRIGRWYWAPGPLWHQYLELGGPGGHLGYPIDPPSAQKDGAQQDFEGGRLVSRTVLAR